MAAPIDMAQRTKQYATYPSLAGRVVVISGGATGIGAALAESFVPQGSQVIILDVLEDAASELIESLSKHNGTYPLTFHRCDLTNIEGELKPVAARILDASPKIDAVINNAAKDTRIPTLDVSAQQWDDGLAVNLRHQFFLAQALMPGLVAAGSSCVINMGSITWAFGAAGMAPYVASKAAIVGLTKSLAREFGPQGVRVNSIMPGAILTERQLREVLDEERLEFIMEQQSLKRYLQPDDVARLALWLVADDGSAVTNQSIVVDAGWI